MKSFRNVDVGHCTEEEEGIGSVVLFGMERETVHGARGKTCLELEGKRV